VTNLAFDRQRADRFAQLQDEADGRRRRHLRTNVDEEVTDLLAVGQRLSRLRAATDGARPADDFREGLRAELMAIAERDGIGVTDTAPDVGGAARPVRRRIALRGPARAAILAVLAIALLTQSSFSVASDAVPGDSLYTFKRQTERAKLAVAGSDLSRGQLYLSFAKTRAEEGTHVLRDSAALESLLRDMDDETYLGVRLLTTTAMDRRDADPLRLVSGFISGQRKAVTDLLETVPNSSRARVMASLEVLRLADERVSALLTSLQCAKPAEPANGATDRLGPMPGTCSARR